MYINQKYVVGTNQASCNQAHSPREFGVTIFFKTNNKRINHVNYAI